MNKYGNRKCQYNGIVFDSRHEMARYRELLLLERGHEISDLRLQVKYVLIPEQREKPTEKYLKGPKKGEYKPGNVIEKACTYIADFVYTDMRSGKTVVEDAKGMKTEVYKIKKKLMLYNYGIRVIEV